jgi:glycosyltransferase involved in cell wall biosynthesis
MTHGPVPTVSIGLAVYNGANYLAGAIESILDQTYTDFELIVSDNASTDETPAIIERYAAKDPRIRVHRNEVNIGGARNENLTFEMSCGKYFRLAAHDDLCAPTLLEACVDVLEADPGIVVCYTGSVHIDDEGAVTDTKLLKRGMALRPSDRFREISARRHDCEPMYGLIRSDALRSVRPQGNYVDADRVLLSELALRGRFLELPVPLFYKRFHAKNAYIDWNARMAWYNPTEKTRIALPLWLAFRGLLSGVFRAPISTTEKLRCMGVATGWALSNWKRLAKDVAVAGWLLTRPRHKRAWPEGAYNWE